MTQNNLHVKMLTKGMLFALTFFVCLSCGQKENTASVAQDNKEVVENKSAQKKNKQDKNKQAKNKQSNNKYWVAFQKELKIDGEKMKQMRALSAKNNAEAQNIRKLNPDDFRTKVKDLRMAEREQVKKILGDALYQKKLTWDKKWAAEHSPKAK